MLTTTRIARLGVHRRKVMKITTKFIRFFVVCVLISISIFWMLRIEITFAQRQLESKADLVDEFGTENCSQRRGRIDNLLETLGKNPSSKAYIIIYGEKNQPFAKHIQKSLLEAFFDFRRFGTDRLTFLQGKDEDNLRVQFWKVPSDSNMPNSEAGVWNYKLSPNIKPYKLYETSWINESECPDNFNAEFYSRFLLANPNLRGHLVIYEKSTKDFNQTRQKLIEELTGKNKVQRNQLRFFYVKSKESNVEFWYVPVK